MLSSTPHIAASKPLGIARCKNAALACLYALTAATLVAAWSLVPTQAAYAYVDPSVMTYTIQAVAGLVVALSAVIGVVFRRTRKKIYQVFNIDEDARKIAEHPVERIDRTDPNAAQRLEQARNVADEQAQACNALVTPGPHTMSYPLRVAFALVICVFFAFIVLIAPAIEIFGSNGDSLVFSLQVVWWVPVVFCLVIAVIAAALIALLQGKPYYVVLAVLFALTVAAYVQSLFLNKGMMPADGGFIGWTDFFFVSKMITSGLIWIAIVAGTIFLCRRFFHTFLKAAAVIACALIIVQLVGVGSVAVDAAKASASQNALPYVTKGGLLTVSPKSNVVVFVLDTYDTSILEEILAEDSNALADFEDFTYFPNSLGTMIPTTNAIPYMMTGLKPAVGQDIGEYRRTKYEKGTFVSDIASQGYSVGVYTDSLMMDFHNPADCETAATTVNIHPVNQVPVDILRTFIAMEQCALYRESPWVLKPAFWYYTSDINNRMIASSEDGNLDNSLYELDDAAILKMVRAHGLHVEDDSPSGAFRFIHLFGPHFPFSVDENGQAVGTNQSNQIDQAKGSMKVVTEYLQQLKDLGLYDDATVIVTADHGIWYLTDDPVSEPISPIMLAKPAIGSAGAAGEAKGAHQRKPVLYSEAPVSHDDLFGTVMEAVHGDRSKYGSTLFEISDPNRIRYFDALTNAGGQGQRFVEYAVHGNALDLSNWQKTGNEWLGA